MHKYKGGTAGSEVSHGPRRFTMRALSLEEPALPALSAEGFTLRGVHPERGLAKGARREGRQSDERPALFT
jgi:hypothetical protein